MPESKPTSRSEASTPETETDHLDKGEKRALDIQGDVEHVDGPKKEELVEEAERLSPPKKD